MKKSSVALILSAIVLCVLLFAGFWYRKAWICSYYIYQGEEYNYKAGFVLRNKKASAGERKEIYRRSCDYFLKAYHYYPQSFDYNRCEYAVESCLWVEDFESVNTFRDLQQSFKDNGGYKEADSPIVMW